VHDLGDNLKITGFDTKDKDDKYDKERYLEVDAESFEKMKELSLGNTLFYPKKESVFSMDKVILEEEDSMLLYQYTATIKAISFFNKNFGELDTYLFLKYSTLSMELSDKNFYMHSDNIEEILEALNKKGNEKLIEKGKELSEVIKEIDTKMKGYDNLQDTLRNIRSSSDKDKVDSLLQSFLSNSN